MLARLGGTSMRQRPPTGARNDDSIQGRDPLDHPVAAVWERLIDWDTADRWMPGVDAVHARGPLAAGSTLVFTVRGKERLATVATLEPGRSITLRSVQTGVPTTHMSAWPTVGAPGWTWWPTAR